MKKVTLFPKGMEALLLFGRTVVGPLLIMDEVVPPPGYEEQADGKLLVTVKLPGRSPVTTVIATGLWQWADCSQTLPSSSKN
jgi:hypothetical protein